MIHWKRHTPQSLQAMIAEGSIQLVCVLSTAHITAQENNQLGLIASERREGPIVRDMTPGYLVNLPSIAVDPKRCLDSVADMPNLRRIMHAVNNAGFTHLRLDPDGPTNSEFNTYDW